MIDDLALLKQAMEQMDAEDPTVAQAAKDRAAQTLSDARLSFAKMAELIEQRRLLLRPRIVANIKRMDQPGMLGEAAFRDAGSALRKEGQSFRQIAEAIEHTGRLRPLRGYGARQRAAAPDGGRAGCVRLAESARFCCAHCFLSAATSDTVSRDRTPRHFSVLRLAWLCRPGPARFGIFRWRCGRPRQRG